MFPHTSTPIQRITMIIYLKKHIHLTAAKTNALFVLYESFYCIQQCPSSLTQADNMTDSEDNILR